MNEIDRREIYMKRSWIRNTILATGLVLAGAALYNKPAQAQERDPNCREEVECRVVFMWVYVGFPLNMWVPGASYICERVWRCSGT